MNRFNVRALKHRDSLYKNIEIDIYEEKNEIELFHLKKKFFKIIPISLLIFNYDKSTFIQVRENRAIINDLELYIDDKETLKRIVEIISKPYQQHMRFKEQKIREVENLFRNFLIERAKILDEVSGVKLNPREKMLELAPMISEGVEDPMEFLFVKYDERLDDYYSETKKRLNLYSKDVEKNVMEKFYALTYRIGMIQNKFFKDSGSKEKDIVESISNLIEGTAPQMDELRETNIEGITSILLDACVWPTGSEVSKEAA